MFKTDFMPLKTNYICSRNQLPKRAEGQVCTGFGMFVMFL